MNKKEKEKKILNASHPSVVVVLMAVEIGCDVGKQRLI